MLGRPSVSSWVDLSFVDVAPLASEKEQQHEDSLRGCPGPVVGSQWLHILACGGCHHEVSQIGWRKPDMGVLAVLEARGPDQGARGIGFS